VATLIKWFPDKRGMITGLAVAGFGAGALVTAPVAQRLIPSVGLPATFGVLGSAYLIAVLSSAFFMKNPPEGYVPPGWQPLRLSGRRRASRNQGTLTTDGHGWTQIQQEATERTEGQEEGKIKGAKSHRM